MSLLKQELSYYPPSEFAAYRATVSSETLIHTIDNTIIYGHTYSTNAELTSVCISLCHLTLHTQQTQEKTCKATRTRINRLACQTSWPTSFRIGSKQLSFRIQEHVSIAGHLFHLGETQLGIKADKLQCHALATLPPPSMHTYPLPTHLQLYFTQIELLAAIFLMTSLTCSLVVVTCLSLKLKHPYQIFLLTFYVVFLVLTVLSCRGQCFYSVDSRCYY